MNYVIASTLLASATADVAQQCSDLSATCKSGCGDSAVFPDCKDRGGSCTPYSFMPNIQNKDCNWMDSDTGTSGAQFQTSPFNFNGDAYSYQAYQASGADDIWIVHGCDGAGIQTDCAGDILYLEHFGSTSPVTEENCPPSTYGQSHYQCPTFYHQGKQAAYPDYGCGWWRGYNDAVGVEDASTDGIGAFGAKDAGDGSNADYSDSIRAILQNCPTCAGGTALEHPYAGTPGAKAFFTGAIFPWICTTADENVYGPYTNSGLNCFCDNEPSNGRQTGGGTPLYPQGTQIIYCGLYEDAGTSFLVCDFIYLDNDKGEAVAPDEHRGVKMYAGDW